MRMAHLWARHLAGIFDAAAAEHRSTHRTVETMFDPGAVAFLGGIGCSAQEMFDFVDDFVRYDAPFEDALLITAVRRDYFLNVLHGRPAAREISMASLPTKSAAVDGIPWLPRLIAKARAKLRGEMPADLMYGCGGDRAFAETHGLHLADFLRVAWAAGDNDRAMIDWVKQQAAPR